MKKIILVLVAITTLGCERTFKEKSDFRNYLRDQHPYSELIEIDLGGIDSYDYQVNDTIKGKIWIYRGSGRLEYVAKHLIIK